MSDLHNFGVRLAADGRLVEAEQMFRLGLVEAPENAETRFSLAKVLLAQERYGEAWPLYEARRQLPRLRLPPGFAGIPEWTGDPLNGRRLVVFGEQGLGDQIMFARFVPPEATYLCSPSLFRLFPNGYPGASKVPPPAADCWALVGSLPRLLGVVNAPPPVRIPVKPSSGGGVGIMLTGASHASNPARQFSATEEARLRQIGRDLSPEATGARDFRETAEIVATLDVVVTVDTAMAHVAGSIGKPTFVLVPALAVYWPWRPSGETTPWYPTIRIFRQTDSWDAALSAIESTLS